MNTQTDAEINRRTIRKWGPLWVKNWNQTWPRCLKETVGVKQLFGKCIGTPTIVINAGPSLNDDILQKLRDLQFKGAGYLLIAVDRAVPILSNYQIVPDIVVCLDPQDSVYTWLSDASFSQRHWRYQVVAAWCHPGLLFGSKAKALMYTIYDLSNPFWVCVEGRFVSHYVFGGLLCGGTVGTVTASLAHMMGCNPVAFVGLDLSSPDRDSFIGACDPSEVTKLKDIYGKSVFTTPVFESSRRWYGWFFRRMNEPEHRHPGAEPTLWVNATGGGILSEGCIRMSFEGFLDLYKPKKGLREARVAPLVEHRTAEHLTFLGASERMELRDGQFISVPREAE